jgi:hypothetical protein
MRIALAALLIAALAGPVQAQPTEITVRVLARDAKFIGTSMGGARVTITDAETGEVLAEGLTEGGTGSTERIMKTPRKRGEGLSDGASAAFHAVVDLHGPRRLQVSAEGPDEYPGSANRVTAIQWVVPGRHLTGGDGWVLEMPGLVVNLHDLPASVSAGDAVDVRATVEMMCGCPLTPGGMWDADDFVIRAEALLRTSTRARVDLSYAGEASEFAGSVVLDEPGVWNLVVWAWQESTGNTGVAERRIEVSP